MSIKQIAEKVGVSPSTVSRVLNNPDYRCSSEQLRKRIWDVAIEMNYAPNEAAKRLKKGEKGEGTFYVNVLLTRTEEFSMDPFFRELLVFLETEIHRRFCVLSRVWIDSRFSDEGAVRGVNLVEVVDSLLAETEGRADGLIVIGRCVPEALLEWKKRYRAVVSINRNPTDGIVDEITCDGDEIAYMAVKYLIDLGHRKIAYIGEAGSEARFAGYWRALKESGIPFDETYVFDRKQAQVEAEGVVEELIGVKDRPTAIYCANDIIAVNLLWALQGRKKQYYHPSVIASDDIKEGQRTKPMLTTVRLYKEDMARHAMYLLLDRIRGGHKGIIRMDIRPKIIERGSTARADAGGWFTYAG